MSSTHPNARCVDSLSYEVPNNIPYLLLAFSQGNNSRRRPLKRPPLRLLLAINTHTHTQIRRFTEQIFHSYCFKIIT